MNIIKINAMIQNTVTDIATKVDDQSRNRSPMQSVKNKPIDQMTALLNLVKTSQEDPFHTQVIQSIKNQVQMDYYKVDINSLVSHLYQELSVEGAN